MALGFRSWTTAYVSKASDCITSLVPFDSRNVRNVLAAEFVGHGEYSLLQRNIAQRSVLTKIAHQGCRLYLKGFCLAPAMLNGHSSKHGAFFFFREERIHEPIGAINSQKLEAGIDIDAVAELALTKTINE